MPKPVKKSEVTSVPKEKKSEEPITLRPYIAHIPELAAQGNDEEAKADCPFCGKENKFTVSIISGKAKCWGCDIGGGLNATTFLREFHQLCVATTPTKQLEVMQEDRDLLSVGILVEWGVCKSITTGQWLVPGYGRNAELNQLYRNVRTSKGMRLLPTPTLDHQMFGFHNWDDTKPELWLLEGPWDAMAMEELIQRVRETDNGYAICSPDHPDALHHKTNIGAFPGCGSTGKLVRKFKDFVNGKIVSLFLDSDYPKNNDGRHLEPAGLAGTKRAVNNLARLKNPPTDMFYINWGEEGFDPELPDGTDVRDMLTDGGADTWGERVANLTELMSRIDNPSVEWMEGKTLDEDEEGSVLLSVPCTDWKALIKQWRKALRWTQGLDYGLSCMLATSVSTNMMGDQLWMRIISPPSGGKSTLAEALSVNKKYVISKSTIRGFHSGFGDGSEDNSLLSQSSGMTLVTKDGDTILKSPNKVQLLSEARDVYDTNSRTSYRNKSDRDYEGLRMTWLLCGTDTLRSMDESDLGERFLDCIIMEELEEEMENDIGWRVAERAAKNMDIEVGMERNQQQDPDLTLAMQMTSGYIDHLRGNSVDLYQSVKFSKKSMKFCIDAAKMVSFMRARPSRNPEDQATREMSARLVSQHIRLAKSLAVVMQRPEVDDLVLQRVRKVALDTAKGVTLSMLKEIYYAEDRCLKQSQIMNLTGSTKSRTEQLLSFLRKIKAIQKFKPTTAGRSTKNVYKFRLSPSLETIFDEIIGPEQEEE